MLSPTMIASSTTIPSTRMKANSESMFIDMPSSGSTHSAPMKEIGIPIVTQKARRKRRKSASTRKTRSSPWMPFLSKRDRRLCRITVRSELIVSSVPAGIETCFSAT